MRRVAIGDVLELSTHVGLAYLQITHRHPKYGFLIRVLQGTHTEPISDVEKLAAGDESFVTFFPAGAALKRGIVRRVGRAAIPEHALAFPLFRSGVVDSRTGRVNVWWLWDGEREWRVDELTPEQRRLPLRGIWNDTLLIARIESGWTPETDPT